MWKKIAIGGAIAAAVVGSGTAALALSGSTTSGTPAPAAASTSSTSTTSTPGSAGAGSTAGRRALAAIVARRALHAVWVTGKTGDFVTHDAIRGQVTAVSPTSITVQAADKTTQTYAVTSSTKVRERTGGKGAPGSIGAVSVGDDAIVIGTGTTSLSAQGILDVKK